MQAEFDVPIFPGSLQKLAELRAQYPTPLTDTDREEEERRSAERGYPVRLVRVGVNTIIVSMLTVAPIMKMLERFVTEDRRDVVEHWLERFGPFIMEHGDDATKERLQEISRDGGYSPVLYGGSRASSI